jgi:hypothetical protein
MELYLHSHVCLRGMVFKYGKRLHGVVLGQTQEQIYYSLSLYVYIYLYI